MQHQDGDEAGCLSSQVYYEEDDDDDDILQAVGDDEHHLSSAADQDVHNHDHDHDKEANLSDGDDNVDARQLLNHPLSAAHVRVGEAASCALRVRDHDSLGRGQLSNGLC